MTRPVKPQDQKLGLPLADFILAMEQQAQPDVVVEIIHPDAVESLYLGRYAGIRLKHGPAPLVTLSNGKVIQE